MNMDMLFDKLRDAKLPADRERLVEQAIAEGADIKEIREMLDYLDAQPLSNDPPHAVDQPLNRASSEPKAS